ncbi:N-acetylmuramoyl-L-alanine amidase family protein [Adlercreutzia muris]|uniref:N-acetylmuramoyl-L-alanine amidase family protein n=1 Tax=Adlercreutzia muris TaxID=1796610 RepID=A0A7C8G0P8_9ACTN|nr:N-acetylmuramoyl-L-alanine amidase family protein [Adlercreutzia muris]KAB1651091.1 N-acetylmuramoyl-L-alanine amidase family protein [Adlercreutzia muris]MCR2028432.1 N-acetylmuramoyl-L-alanine amidase family protein [Adlercreutzia muris]MCU7584671.1 N-acetylmuramoyl-L-alanine amidase family protein [Adlercreutzia muris]
MSMAKGAGWWMALLAALAVLVSVEPPWAYGDEPAPMPESECQDYISALADSFAAEIGVDLDSLSIEGPRGVYDISSSNPVYAGSQCWTIYCDDELAAFIFSVETAEGATFTLSTNVAETMGEDLGRLGDEGAMQFAFCDEDLIYLDEEAQSAYKIGFDEVRCYDGIDAGEWTAMASPKANVLDSAEAESLAAAVTVTSSKALGVPYVTQGSDPICWAASACQAGRYLTKNNTWTAVSLSNDVKGSLSGGTVADTRSAYTRFTYPNSSTRIATTHISGAPSELVIGRWINAGLPIHARTTSNNGSGHAVIVDGYRTYSSGAMAVRIVNPGIQSPGVIFATKSSGYYQFFYNTNEGNTFKWDRGSVLFTGWQKPFGGSSWSYLSNAGAKSVGWLEVGSNWFYFNSSGYMLTGWQSIEGKWYYLNSTGAAATGWQKIDGYWYAFDSNCAMRRGWFKDGTTWYYLRTLNNTPAPGPEGAMLANGTWTIGGKAYRFNTSGACLNP